MSQIKDYKVELRTQERRRVLINRADPINVIKQLDELRIKNTWNPRAAEIIHSDIVFLRKLNNLIPSITLNKSKLKKNERKR